MYMALKSVFIVIDIQICISGYDLLAALCQHTIGVLNIQSVYKFSFTATPKFVSFYIVSVQHFSENLS